MKGQGQIALKITLWGKSAYRTHKPQMTSSFSNTDTGDKGQ